MNVATGLQWARDALPVARVSLPFQLTRDLFAAGPAREVGAGIAASVDDIITGLTKTELLVPGTGISTTHALVSTGGGTLGLVPLGMSAPAWEPQAVRAVRLNTLNSQNGALGSNIRALDDRLIALIDGPIAVRVGA
ncbi:MAG: hypothetical protein H7123_01765 [Thermoleophilia bacterium]|nr:hypothetical protein [Thermoleophilia bacterium]